MHGLPKMLIVAGVVLIVSGVVVYLAARGGLPIGRLPGDFVLRRGNVTCAFPLMTSILLSIVLSLIFWFFRR